MRTSKQKFYETQQLVNKLRAITEYDPVTNLPSLLEVPVSDYEYIAANQERTYGTQTVRWSYRPVEIWLELVPGLNMTLQVRFNTGDFNNRVSLVDEASIERFFITYRLYRKRKFEALTINPPTSPRLVDILPKIKSTLKEYPQYRAELAIVSSEITDHKLFYPYMRRDHFIEESYPTIKPSDLFYPVMSRIRVVGLREMECPDSVRRGVNSAVLDFSAPRQNSEATAKKLYKDIKNLIDNAPV